MVAVLRAWRLGILAEDELRTAIKVRGQNLDLGDIVCRVQARLPNFLSLPVAKAEVETAVTN